MAVDFKALNRNQQGALVAGALAIILSFFSDYVTVDLKGPADGLGVSFGASNAWHSYATLGMLLILVATALVAVKAFSAEALPDGVPWALITAAAAGLGTLLVILRAFTYDGSGIADIGPGWSGWLLFVAAIALTVFSVLSFRESGESMPDFKGEAPPAPPAA
ncbi:hypothetical protein [Aeromicrobium terrae]|uniref:Uncharacterized protein n=1 Tax=Aeromicrobium terrae TaxID=2498846 RepID=A0A5C8NN24_9ACTN|nr:hypothetical protein [Aeromicrobium terrae]TXL63224.1 hypothetical protein FHP06_03085 [Aeromicrobium terrae]